MEEWKNACPTLKTAHPMAEEWTRIEVAMASCLRKTIRLPLPNPEYSQDSSSNTPAQKTERLRLLVKSSPCESPVADQLDLELLIKLV